MISEDQKTLVHPEISDRQKSENCAIIVWISGLSALIYFFCSYGIKNHILFLVNSFKKILGSI
jgi:hypothetical protein